MLRKSLFLIAAVCISISAFSSSSPAGASPNGEYEKLIAEAMNSNNWFALDSLYKSIPENSLSDFTSLYAQALIGNRFNRPEISIPAFEKLLQEYSGQLDLNDKLDAAMMMSMDLSRIGNNDRAASILDSILYIHRADLPSKIIEGEERFINQYRQLAAYTPYSISFNSGNGAIPFHLVPIGKPEDKGIHIRLDDSFINGIEADITFDTGAAVNVISDSLVNKYHLTLLDVDTKVNGAKSHTGTFAIAKELKIGNIVINDVPFYVMNITSHNSEADAYLNKIDMIVGSELMLQLKDLTIDFVENKIIVPAEAPSRTDVAPNLCFSSGMNMLSRGYVNGKEILMNIDSGDSSYGVAGESFYKENKKYIKSHSKPSTVRRAGIGGIEITKSYDVSDLTLEFGGCEAVIPSLDVIPKDNVFGIEFNLGLKSLALYKTVRFNLVDFVVTATE